MKTAKFYTLFFILLLCLLMFGACEVKYSEDAVNNALLQDDTAKIAQLLENIAVDTLKFEEGRNLLQKAILRGANKVTKYMIDNYNLQDSIDDYGYTALHIAILNNYDEEAKMLVNKGSNLNSLDGEGYSPLHYATLTDKIDLVKQMIEKGADFNLKTAFVQSTPLHLAIERENYQLAEFFQSKNAIDTIKDGNDNTPKMLALESVNPKIINLYFNSFSDAEKNILLYNMIRKDSTSTNIANWIDQKWISKNTLQEAFIFITAPKVASLVLTKGVDIHKTFNTFGYSAIHYAAIRGDINMLAFLLENGADVNSISKSGKSPLMYAAELYDDVLLKQDVAGFPFVMSQTYLDNFGMSYDKNVENSLAAVTFLLSKNANLNFKNKEDKNALYCAATSFNTKVVDYLKEQGIKETKPFVESEADRNRRVLGQISREAMLRNMNNNY